ncbi:MAG: pyridoxamine 5'-phosphate oxidase family protein [Methanocalculus sp. MSAO_Arc1]|uniref:pyridoxamine 5'-phosphate oxidase family protein n=1 Tax=Methanocalculus TaxID=71151 RepID=UPI000FF8502E|nr:MULTISPECIES: pyridoxamine 5'-phosphate oxidase family protein [unclassified Methanocalculus]MCP1661805.1 putative pyridoxine 5'-phosphate oxidase superfamily flavin-nucleotide-binding protein [Methanocalculus sp. AMF5]RQD80197.1 MAG: pyridoxamine 5'-phosphate oxidase family protein [Methanocalculus sp. MSAO_Arc1]
MVHIDEKLKESIAEVRIVPLATASKDGIPNVVPMGSVWVMDEKTIWIGDNFMQKTLQNVLENPHAALYVWSQSVGGCVQLKCDVVVETSGENVEKMRAMIHEKKPNLPGKSLLILTVKEKYECAPGPNAGKLLD